MTKHDFLKKVLAVYIASLLIVPQGAALVAYAAEAAVSPSANPAVFRGIEISNDKVIMKLSSPAEYNSFVTQTPPRLVMEFLDTKNSAVARETKGRGKYLAGVRTSQFRQSPRMITRVVIDLVKMAVYKITEVSGGLAVQLIGSDGSSSAARDFVDAPSDPTIPDVVSLPSAAKPKSNDFMAGLVEPKPEIPAAAAVRQEVKTASEVEPEPELESADRTHKPVRTRHTSAAAALKRAGLEGKMTSDLAGAADSEDLSHTKTTIPSDVGDGPKIGRGIGGRIYSDMMSRLPRDVVSLDYDNTDIRDVLKLLAAKARINIIYGTDVNGVLTLHLSNVPFNEAFRTVLSMMQLSTDQVGDNILRVITPGILSQQRTAATSVTKVIQLNYAKASAVKTTIDSVRSAEGRTGSSSIDTPTNSLIVTESLEGMLATENLVAQLDQRPRQVLIESKIVEVDINSELDYGIQWDAFGIENGKIGGKSGTNVYGSAAGITDSPFNRILDRNTINTSLTGTGGIGAGGRGTGVGLPADKIMGAFTLGRVTNNMILNATISAASSEGKAKVLSDPKIATLNNQPANINVTTSIPYVTSNVSSTGVQTQTVSFVQTGIQLTVTPSINADNRILLQINPNISQPSVTAAANTQTGAPATDTRSAQTSVLVRDGETIVIGGLITDSLQDTIAKVPILGDIPILGWLFKKKTKKRVRNELLIFVTTRILPD